MKVAIGLFVHAVRLVLNNMNQAIRTSALLYGVPVIVLSFYSYLNKTAEPFSGGFATTLVVVVAGCTWIAGCMWIAVAWHRFVLLDDAPAGWLPGVSMRRLAAYFVATLALSIIALLGAMVVFAAGVLLGMLVNPPVTGMISAIALLAAQFLFLLVFYRLGLVLPAASLGRPISLREAWSATEGAAGTIVSVVLLSLVAQVIIGLPTMVFAQPLALAWKIASDWLALMVGVSVLTVLYGYYAEGRGLPE